MKPRPSRFLTVASLALGLPFVAIALLPETSAMVVSLASVFVGIPLAIILYVDYVRAIQSEPELKPDGMAGVLLVAPVVIFGVTSIFVGLSIVVWVAYNAFVERLPEYTGPVLFGGFGIGPMLAGFGWSLLRSALRG